ncbi:hypothetical protein PUNSTDRAFT_138214 [Punctularia strigosozonata HHB-11173 SS5]|uniref:Nucleoporin Nup159/Nup146 N-terminal domain-containing protein n=1 Tax=Punctularia strigosozonata (strain HHB-11173) TaxID=741275 RepID=R7S486_PUNST|nr:uncharacterized protein PUNSTDRAFT_138214 [Punctularia strigosozonata HHB-11173 SS5]EIN05033.1 hypothetical protein PUNSTDRAFT_138214 [Punctularia strigosozonata HHB-11173 SS5]
MSIWQIQPVPQPQVARISKEASEKDAGFLAYKLVNKRTRIRLSRELLDLNVLPGKAQLFAIATSKSWFAAVVRQSSAFQIVFSPVSQLYSTLSTSKDEETSIQPSRTLPFSLGTPTTLVFALHDSRFVVSTTQGQVHVFDASVLLTAGSGDVQPLRSFPSPAPGGPRQIVPNPGDIPELIAVLHETDAEVIDVQKLEPVAGWKGGGTPETTPTTLTWSPKGKQIAIGLQSGSIVTFAPTAPSAPKSTIPAPPSAAGKGVISASWLSNPMLHTIYAPSGSPLTSDSEQTHYIVALDAKSSTAADVKLETPYFPLGPRPPGAFVLVLRNWEPAKFLLIVGDSTSSDIGSIACLDNDEWYNLSLEDTAKPTMPLDWEMKDTIVAGLELDFSCTEPYSHVGVDGASTDLPPTPILYAYANDGTVLGWHVVNTSGKAYPGMLSAGAGSSFPEPMKGPEVSMGPPSAFPISRQPSAVASQQSSNQPATSSAFGSSGFGQQQQQQSAFGQSAFGQSGFGSSATNNAGGSAFGQSAFGGGGGASGSGSGTTGGGFAAFAQPGGGSAFGQSAFGATNNAPGSAFGTANNTGSAFGSSNNASGSAFGSGSNTSGSAFGSTNNAAGSAFGSANALGGAFGSTHSTGSAFGQPSTSGSAFGQSAFGGNSGGGGGFGAFAQGGAAKFGATGFGSQTQSTATAAPATPIAPEASMSTDDFGGLSLGGGSGGDKPSGTTGTTGLFGNAQPSAETQQPTSAFGASAIKPASGFGAFGGSGSSAFSNPGQNPSQPSAFGSTSAFGGGSGAGGQSAFDTSKSSPSFGSSGFGQSGFGQSAFGQSAFGKSAFGSTPSANGSAFSPSPSTGGFSAFASGGTSAFSAAAAQNKPAAAAPTGGGFSAFASNAPSSFTSAAASSNTGGAGEGAKPAQTGFSAFASGGPSAFSAAANTQEQPKSAFASGGTSAFSTGPSQEAKSMFSSTPTQNTEAKPLASPPPEPEKPQSAFGGGNDAKPSSAAPSQPTSVFAPKSPETPTTETPVKARPNPVPGLEDSPGSPTAPPADTATPLSSPFKSSAPATTGGAFGNLVTSPGFGFGRPSEGFGAFGNAVNKDSPFFSPPKPTTPSAFKPISAFSPSTPPAQGASTTPTFGTPSAFGKPTGSNPSTTPVYGPTSAFGKSAFASPGTPTTTTPKTDPPATGGFAAFSGTSAFAKVGSGSGKSFSDMLKEGAKDESPKKPASAFASVASTTPKGEPSKKPEEGQKAGDLETPTKAPTDKNKESAEKGKDFTGKGKEPAASPTKEKDARPDSSLSAQSSFADVSLADSQISAFSEVSRPEQEDAEGSDAGEPTVEDDTGSFVSEDFSDEEGSEYVPSEHDDDGSGSESPPNGDESEKEPETSTTVTPAAESKGTEQEPAPATPEKEKSRSPTPKPAAPLATPDAPKGAPASSATESTTTPPGSPEKQGEVASKPSIAAPTPINPMIATPDSTSKSPTLGLGKPTTRPARSSPLANAPVVNATKEDEQSPEFTSPSSMPKPASPKTPFGVLPGGPVTPAASTSPPKIPLFGSLGGQPVTPKSPSPKPAAGGFAMPTLPASASKTSSAASKPSIFSSPLSFPSPSTDPTKTSPTIPQPTPPASGLKLPAFSGFPATTPPAVQSPFSKPISPAISAFAPTPSQASAPFNIPNLKPTTVATPPIGGFFSGAPTPSLSVPTPFVAPVSTIQEAKPPSVEEGMQAECAYLYLTLTKELEDLRVLAKSTLQRKSELQKPVGGSRNVADLATAAKWSLGDLSLFGQTMRRVRTDIKDIKERRLAIEDDIRRLESDMLKVNTKKEEIARFSRASTDAEFARMLKIRTLGPEHLETQSRLRRDIRTMRDRLQKLEDHLLECKKKLNEMKTGKPHFRPPSLDTINRTYRNIEAAIEQQAADVTRLSSRVAKLDLGGKTWRSEARFTGRDKRPSDTPQRAFSVTPDVAATTAAALNAERSAQKLKSALLKARREPLLNSTAVHVPSVAVPTAFDSPAKPSLAPSTPGPRAATSTPVGLFSLTPNGAGSSSAAPATPDWSLPAFDIPATDDSPSSGGSLRQRSSASKHHQKPVQLRKAPTPSAQTPPKPTFDWGPLPTAPPPRTSLVAEFRAASQSPSASPTPATNGAPNVSPGPKLPFSFAGFGGSK